MGEGAYLLDLREPVPYVEAWDLQRSLAAAVSQDAMPETVILLEHPPVITLGRRTDQGELHVPADAPVDVVETNRGGKSTYHAPGQLICYPILDLKRHGKDVKKYVRDLEEALIRTLAAFGIGGARIEGLTGVWLHAPPAAPGASLGSGGRGHSATGTGPRLEHSERRERPAEPGFARREQGAAKGSGPPRYASGFAGAAPRRSDTSPPQPPISRPGPPRKIASIGVHVSRWITTHGYALNVDLDPAPFTDWITACGLEDAAFTTIARELGRPVTVDEVRPRAAEAIADVFGLRLEPIPADDGPGLWPQPVHERLAVR